MVFRFGLAGSQPAAGDRCEVYQCGIVNRQMDQIAENTPQTFSCDLSYPAQNQDATLV